MREFGPGVRGLLTIGDGLALRIDVPVIAVELRAWHIGKRRRGLVARLGWNVGYGECVPPPQFGLVPGVATH